MKLFLASIGMFTKVKVNSNVFENNSGPGMICFLPLAGAFCGAFTALVYWLCMRYEVNAMLAAAILLFSLFFVSGFLHLDGFMDCSDALLSARDREGKVRILKDSTVGAFSVISVCLLLLVDFSSLYVLYSQNTDFLSFILIPFASRAFIAVVLFTFKPLENNKGLLFFFRDGMKKYHIVLCIVQFVVVSAVFALINLNRFYALMLSSVISFLVCKTAERLLGGINGDVTGGGIIVFEAFMYFISALVL